MATRGRRIDVDPRPTLAELQASWESCPAAEPTVFTCSIGGLVLRVEGHGELVEHLVPALTHHPSSSDLPDLTIRVWDLSVANIRPHVAGELFHIDGDHDLGDASGEIRVRYDWPQRVLQAWDASAGVAYWVAEDPSTLAWWEEAAPFRPVLAWWLTSAGRYFAHGAALARDGKAVLLVGPGGSGKSTTALRAQRAGLDFLGDDYCLVAAATTGMSARPDADYSVGSLYRTVKLRPVDGPAFETELTSNEHGRKIVLALGDGHGGELVGVADLVGVAAVEIGTGATEIESGAAGRVLQALAPTTFDQLPGIGGRSLTAFAEMLRRLPTAVVRLGEDPDDVVASVRCLIDGWS